MSTTSSVMASLTTGAHQHVLGLQADRRQQPSGNSFLLLQQLRTKHGPFRVSNLMSYMVEVISEVGVKFLSHQSFCLTLQKAFWGSCHCLALEQVP